jgi:hypothetical protein
VDLATLERGLRRFLEELERKAPPPAWPPEGPVLWPWLVAGAAAACEITRRQWRRPAAVPALGGPPSPDDSAASPVAG